TWTAPLRPRPTAFLAPTRPSTSSIVLRRRARSSRPDGGFGPRLSFPGSGSTDHGDFMEAPVYYRVTDPRAPNAPPLMLTFREDTELNAEASKEAGFEVFDTVLTALVSPAGQVKSNVSRIVRRV